MIFNEFYWQPNVYIDNSVPFPNGSPHCRTYLVHEACWRVLLDRTLYGNPFTDFVAVALAQLFWGASLYRQYSYIRRHDYGGSTEFWDAEGDSMEAMTQGGYGHCVVEPSGFVNIEDLLSCLGPEIPVEIPATSPITSTSRLEHGSGQFTKLPVEVIHMLLTWLRSDDIQRLRLASRPVASTSHPDQLPQFFWHGRFFPDFEMGFAMPIRIEWFHDWRSLYFRVKCGLKTHSSDRLVNRKRVWNFICKEEDWYQRLYTGSDNELGLGLLR